MRNNKKIHKLKLSPGQALLIVIEKFKKLERLSEDSFSKLNEEEISGIRDYIEHLSLLYLSGVESEADQRLFVKAMDDEALADYSVSYDYDTINEDPTKRYFETHLSALTLKHALDKLDKADLDSYYSRIHALLSAEKKIEIRKAFGSSNFPLTGIYVEYISVFKNLNASLVFQEASTLNQEKMRLLVGCSLLGVMAIKNSNIKLPVNIYGQGLFYKENRGLKFKAQQDVRSNHLGIMKSYMPLPKGDLAYMDEPISYLRSADNTTFDKSALWPRVNFSQLTHPFSSSLSGTILCQLRVINYFLENSMLVFDTEESLAKFMRCFVSIMLYQTGGHSIQEYTNVLTLPDVRKAFKPLQGFENINKETLFFSENKKAFFEALDNTIVYHNALLAKKRIYIELLLRDKNRSLSEEEKWELLNKELIKEMKSKYNFYIYDCLSDYLDKKFKEIEWIAQKNNLSIKDILYFRNIFLKRLSAIDFFKAYSNNKFKRGGTLNLEITSESFSSYIYSETIAPELADLDQFVRDSLFSPILRDSYLNLLKNIKGLIATYQGGNKKNIVDLFNKDTNLLTSYIQETISPDIECIKNKLINYVDEIQARENRYYTNLFFAKNFRKSHSSLQLKINEAKNIINKFITDEPSQSQGVKPKI